MLAPDFRTTLGCAHEKRAHVGSCKMPSVLGAAPVTKPLSLQMYVGINGGGFIARFIGSTRKAEPRDRRKAGKGDSKSRFTFKS